MFSPPLFHLSFYQQSKTFAEESNKFAFFQSSLLIKFLENGLDIFKLRGLVLHFFLLKLRVTFDFALGHVNKNSGVTKILLKKSF